MSLLIVIMGVAGSGKTTAGRTVTQQLNRFSYDGDDFHTLENVAKMRSGTPLDDSDRFLWLSRLHTPIADHLSRGRLAVITCSALKRIHRDLLREGNEIAEFIYLRGSQNLIHQCMEERNSHYFKEDLLISQFEILEEPGDDEVGIVDIAQDVDKIVNSIVRAIEKWQAARSDNH